jgi:hypothetical protein
MLIVTATDLPRLMACNGSRLMGGANPPVDSDNVVRDEGNAADWLVQQIYNGHFTAEELIDRKAPNGIYITAEMVEFLEPYIHRPGVIELDTSHAGANWQVNGRADRVNYIRETATLKVDDLKYGWSIVEPEENWTLISHVMGFMAQNPSYPVERAELTIFQPRPHHPDGPVRTWHIDRARIAELYAQMNATLSNPTDILNTSPNCYRCPALAICPAARKAQMNGIEASENAFVDNIDNDNLSFQLDHVARAMKLLKQMHDAYSELALYRLKAGQVVRNYSVENELANRSWLDHVTPEFMQMITGKDISQKQLISPAQAEKMGITPEVVSAMTTRKQKGFKLARVDADKKAKKLFGGK